jgi:hypothetical protein
MGAALLLVAASAAMTATARADDFADVMAPAEPRPASDLAAAIAPLTSEGAADAAARATPREPGVGGLRCWLGAEPRAADAFDAFARPVTNLQFHHPFIWSEIRPVYVNHRFPETSIVEGGKLQAIACQIHAKITDDLQLTAYKDGYVRLDSGLLPDDDGFADIAVGLKYAVWRDLDAPAIFTIGAAYETTWGDTEVLEGRGSIWDLFGSYARPLGPLNLITTAGFIVPTDSDKSVRVFHWHAHADFPVTKNFSPLVEINGFHYMSNAERNAGLGPTVPLGVEGFDYSNLGSDNVKGNDVITGAIGFRWFLSDDVSFGAAYEVALTDREDLLDRRITADIVLRF